MSNQSLLSKVGLLITLAGSIFISATKANASTFMDWDDYAATWTPPTSGETKSFTSGGETTDIKFLLGTQTSFANFVNNGLTPIISSTLNGTNPDTNKSLHIQIDPSAVGLQQGANSATLTTNFKNFGGLVEGVSFNLFDIDILGSSWQDRVILKGFAGGQVVNPIFSILDSTTVKKVNNYTLDGIKAANNDANNGNVAVSFASAIDSFELVFTDGDGNGTNLNPGSHGIGIGDIIYTKAVPESSTLLGLLAVGALGTSAILKRKSKPA